MVFGGGEAVSAIFRGRDAELGVLGEQLDRVRAGSGAVVLIEGAAGMGKSRLMGEGVRMARRLSLRVGMGVAEPSESVAELAPLLRAVFDGPEPLLDRAGLSSLHAAPEQRYWRLQDLQSLLERAAMDSPPRRSLCGTWRSLNRARTRRSSKSARAR
jgi:predicted ATPase